ncbi:MAG: Maf family protein [Eubacteriales bacterium]|nr:Maf family protein [Eubacteriales bacterium]
MLQKDIPIILASASPRRTELMNQAGFSFEVIPSKAEEQITETAPQKIVEELAFLKANEVYNRIKKDYTGKDFIVIGADTIVYYDNDVLGKPADSHEAYDIIKMLSDRTHQVYTGIAIIKRQNGEKQSFLLHEKTDVTFYPISDQEIKDYIATGDPLDKAGAYGIQGPFAIHIKEIHGDYNNVVGLPIAKLYHALCD